jgi:flagellar motor protein MotB
VGRLPADHVKTEGFGESKPLATNETPQGRALNRRIEILIVNRDDDAAAVGAVSSGPPSQ